MWGIDRRRIVGWRGGIDRMEKPDATPTGPICRRETRNQLHKLHDILIIVSCAVLSGVAQHLSVLARLCELSFIEMGRE